MTNPKKVAAIFLALGSLTAVWGSPAKSGGLECLSTVLWSKAYDVAIEGNIAYAAFLNGLVIIDITIKSAPAEMSRLYLGGGFDIEKQGTLAFIAAGKKGLKIVDVANPRNPVLRGEAATSGIAKALAVRGGNVFVADGESGLLVFDVSNPAAPRLLASLETGGEAEGLTLDGDTALIAAGEACSQKANGGWGRRRR